MLTRRKFIKALVVGSAAAVVSPSALMGGAIPVKPNIDEWVASSGKSMAKKVPGHYGFVNWKTYTRSVNLNEKWMCRVEALA